MTQTEPASAGGLAAGGAPLALFDLDGTLVRGDTLLPFALSYAWRTGRPWRALALPVWLALYACRLLSARTAKERLLRSCFQGEPLAAVADHAEWFWTTWVRPRLKPAVLAALEAHRAAGHRLVLVSASPDLYVPALARRLGFTDVVCTQVAARAGVCLGAIRGANCKGPAKVAMTRRRLDIDRPPPGSYAYGDSPSDRHILAWVAHGVRVA